MGRNRLAVLQKGVYFETREAFEEYLAEQEANGATCLDAYFPTGVQPGYYDNWTYGYVHAGVFYNCWWYDFYKK